MAASLPQAAKAGLYALVSCCYQPAYTSEPLKLKHQEASNQSALMVAMYQNAPRWVKDDFVEACMHCSVEFDLLTRKHHCRGCGCVYCDRCTSNFDRVVHFGFLEPVRLCASCASSALIENVFYEKYLPILEDGDWFRMDGLLRKKLVFLKFVRAKSTFQYQKLNHETKAPEDDIRVISLDEITEVHGAERDPDSFDFGVVIAVGSQEHIFDATSEVKRRLWVDAITGACRVRNAMRAREREKHLEQMEKENEDFRKKSETLQQIQERRATFQEGRMHRRAELREQLRIKYQLASAAPQLRKR